MVAAMFFLSQPQTIANIAPTFQILENASGWGCSSVVQSWLNLYKAPGIIPSNREEKQSGKGGLYCLFSMWLLDPCIAYLQEGQG